MEKVPSVSAPQHSHRPNLLEKSRSSSARRMIGSLGVIVALCGMGTAKAALAPAVNLGWNAVPEAGIQGYRIYVGTQSNQYTKTYDTGTSTAFTVSDLEAGQGYHFAVSAIGSTGLESDLSSEITVTTAPPPPPLPGGWTGANIGAVGVPGSSSQSGGVYTVSGSGKDIWGSSDECHFASTTMTGDGEIRARVTSQTNTSAWAKAGVMIRNGTASNAAHAMMMITPGNGFAFIFRASTGGTSTHIAGPALNTMPNNWVRLTRSGSLFTSYVSANGTTWTQIGQATIAMGATVTVGLPVTSRNDSVISTATFDNVTVTPYALPWLTTDIGSDQTVFIPQQESLVTTAGRAEFFNNIHTVTGAGMLGGTNDGFRYVYQTLSGDGSIVARVDSLQNTGASACVGVMIRDTLATNSRMASLGVTGSGEWRWQRRTTAGGKVSTTKSSVGTAPNIWVRITRSGNTFTASRSINGSTWTTINSTTITMGSNCYIGLIVASGSSSTLNTSQFSNLNVIP
jgi:regulation of enolase protein 1 (concanavalin A-like superfamily)